jgi:proline iminopeptidase
MRLSSLARGAAFFTALLGTGVVAAAQTGYVTTSDSARLYYRIIGLGADTIIAIHGGPGMDQETIAADFAVLGEKHTVVFYDQRGGGRSTLPRDTMQLAASYAIAHPANVTKMVFFGPVPPRRGDLWQRFGKTVNSRLDSTQRAAMSRASRRQADSTNDTRQACRGVLDLITGITEVHGGLL